MSLKMRFRVITCILMVYLLDYSFTSTYCPYNNQDVVRLRSFNMDQLQKLKTLIDNYPNLHIKPWVQAIGPDTPSLYMAPSETAEYLVAQAKAWGMDASVVTYNVQKSLLERPDPSSLYTPYKYIYENPAANRTRFTQGQHPENFRLDEFHALDEINAYMQALKARYPKLCDVENIGQSFNGKDMLMLKIGTNSNTARGIFIDAAMHAREWVSTSTALYLASQLITQYYKNADIKGYVDNITWYIVPVVNVDGYEYTWNVDRNWRRSRSQPDPCKDEECRCRGVDLNRNWNSRWNTTDACWHPCCNTFPGTKPMSEPEVRLLSEKIKSLESKVQAYLTLHSYGQMWMYPYGYRKGEYPKDVADLHEIGERAVQAVAKVSGNKYGLGSVADTLYEYSGGSQDWVKQHTKVKYSYIVELRPPAFDGVHAGHFCVNFSQILPTGQEIFEGIKVIADAIQGKFKITGKSWKKRMSSANMNTNSSLYCVCLILYMSYILWQV